MMKINDTRLPKAHPSMTHRVAGVLGVALLLMTGFATAQDAPATPATANAPVPAGKILQDGFFVHNTVDLGGHIVGISGSGSMYDTLVNIQSGPRVLGQTITLLSVPGSKHPLLDSLTGFSNGYGGDPINVVKLDFSKGKFYEFSGMFRRDRQYFDYDLFGNPNIPGGQTINIGPAGAGSLGKYAWPQVLQSPEMFNTVRRMTDADLTIFPLSKFTFHVGYSRNIFQGPRSIPGGYSTAKTNMLFQEIENNTTDEYRGAIDWKPLQQTIVTFEEVVNHYKNDSYFVLNPNQYTVQEANGLPVSLGAWDSPTPYAASNCNTNSIATPGVILTVASGSAGLPVVDPACSVISSYSRYQPTRTILPTEMLRFQSSSIRNIAANGIFRYTAGNTNLPSYQENFQGLNGVIRTANYKGSGTAKRQNVGIDFAVTWQITPTFSLSDQVDFSNVRIPGTATFAGVTANTPSTAHNETINYVGPFVPGVTQIVGQAPAGLPLPNYFGQRILTNHATATWDITPRTMLSLTYLYQTRFIGQKIAAYTGTTLAYPTENINIAENGGIVNIALHPAQHWTLNGSAKFAYADNAYTPVGARQTRMYNVHTTYQPKPWATVSGAYIDTEHHNNTYNTANDPSVTFYAGPLQHVDYSRVGSIGVVLAPSEHYGLDFNYAYSDVYASTNICYLNGATPTLPGTATLTPAGTNAICPGSYARGVPWGPAKDFADAPTQYASVGLNVTPNKRLQGSLGYIISAVSGNQFFNDARQVNGSLQSAWQTPYVHVAWTVHPDWIFKADYDYYGYGEGGPSGAPLCSTATSLTAVVVPCNSPTLAPYPTGLTEPPSGLTLPRNFHANLVTLSMHYEF